MPIVAATDFVGASACAPCHPSQFRTQSISQHAKAMRPINESPLPALLMDRPLREKGGISYEYEVVDEGLKVTVHRYDEEISALLEWTLGGGVQGLSAVGRTNGNYFEHRVSYYPVGGKPAITPGHPLGRLRAAREGLGLPYDGQRIAECFNCHATGVSQTRGGPELTNMQPGIHCERCHGAGAAHVKATQAGQKDLTRTIENPGRGNALQIVELCGDCHRLPEPGNISARPEKDDPFNVRFQPMGLMASRCFSGSEALSCSTCHNPHEDVRKDHAFYVAKCLECHDEIGSARKGCRRAEQEDCLPCHMPRASPSPFLYFTDHRIRVE